MIFLTILKVIGIILLIILALLVLALLAVLFCPFRYRLSGSIDHKDYSFEGKVSWLFNLAALYISYDKELNTRLRIAFFNKNLSGGREQNEPEAANSIKADTENSDDNQIDTASSISSGQDKDIQEQSENANNIEDSPVSYSAMDSSSLQDDTSLNPVTTSSNEDHDSESDEKNPKKNKANKNKPRKGKKKSGKLSGLKNKLSEIKEKLSKPASKAALNKLKTEFFRLLKKIMPDKLYLELVFSTGQPDKTGLALGILAMFPIGYVNRWKISPDFESDEFYLKGKWDIRGKIRMITPLGCVLRILLDKNCRKLYNEFK